MDAPPPGYDYVVIWRGAEGPATSARMEGYYWVTRDAQGQMVETQAPIPLILQPKLESDK